MDLQLDDQQAQLRDEARDWLRTHVPSEPLAPVATRQGLEQHRSWEQQLFEAGLAAVHWPVEHGGRGMDALSTAIFYDEYLAAGAPDRLNRLGLGLAGPTIIELGDDRQRERWLTNILSCEEIWCQGFSEPGSGSDLASVSTRGDVDEDKILINGQKIWTSHSRFADWIFALVRTDSSLPKHRGLTFLMIDRHSPGVEVRPIRQMNHAADFAELFFTDVAVPRENIIGELNGGWAVAMTTLKHERGSNLNTAAHFHRALAEAISLVPEHRLVERGIREQIGRFHEEIEAYRYMTLRTLSEISQGGAPGPQGAMGKLWWSEMQVRLHEFGLSMLGDRAELLDPSPSSLVERYWLGRAAQIYAGSNEIQRNIIAERVLGLPKGT